MFRALVLTKWSRVDASNWHEFLNLDAYLFSFPFHYHFQPIWHIGRVKRNKKCILNNIPTEASGINNQNKMTYQMMIKERLHPCDLTSRKSSWIEPRFGQIFNVRRITLPASYYPQTEEMFTNNQISPDRLVTTWRFNARLGLLVQTTHWRPTEEDNYRLRSFTIIIRRLY